MQVPELQGTFSSRLSEWSTPALLPSTRLPQGSKTGEPAGVAGQVREPKLFPGCQERRAGSRLAEGASRLLEEHRSLPAAYLTRRLPGAKSCPTRRYFNLTQPYLARPLYDANAPVCGADLHVRRQYLTRRHRHQRPTAANQGPRHFGHGAQNET